MKFWIDKNGFIYLFQILKAANLEDDYQKISYIIRDGQVAVNGETCFKQREILKNGDTVKYRNNHLKVLERTADGEKPEKYKEGLPPKGNVKHGKLKQWKKLPVNEELTIQKQIDSRKKALHKILIDNQITLSAAESCTGGMLQEIITSMPGASSYYLGGVITYAKTAKINILGIDEHSLSQNGQVSEQTAIAMAQNCMNLFGSILSCGITGIAGPTGDDHGNPLGTVHIAVCFKDKIIHSAEHFKGNRQLIRKKSCLAVIKLLAEILENI